MKILPISFAPSFLLNATRGALIGAAIFLVFALVMAALAAHSDKSIVKTKIMDAIKTSAIQRPGKWDVTDKRGIDTFTDCLVLQASILDHGNFLQDMFDSLVYKRKLSGTSEPKMHRCDVLVDVLYDTNVESPGVRSYSRYWWGSAVTARIVLGMTGLSVDAYRQTIWILSFASLLIFILVFFLCYGRVFFVFLPFFLSSVFGYGLLILGQSIAHAPEFIGGLLLLSAYGLGNVQRLSFGVRAIWYSLLGCICIYFDLMDANVVLIEIMLCCQIIAPYIAHAHKIDSPDGKISPTFSPLFREIVTNSSFVMAGGCLAIILRVIGYSISSHTNIHDVVFMWTSHLSYRMSGSLAPAQNLPPSLYKLFVALKDHREYPFYGIFSKRFADLFYALGFAGWAIALPFCWVLHKKGNPHIDAALGLTMVASLVPAWFLFFEQHTIIHAWMTGRLVSLFCGLGISLAALVAWAYLVKQPVRQISKEQKPPD